MFAEALKRRVDALPEKTTAFRWIDGELPGVTVDVFADVAVLSLYRDATPEEELQLGCDLMEARPMRAVYLKRRPKEARNAAAAEAAPATPLLGEPVESVEVEELGVKFQIRPGNGLSVGLYLDARDARAFTEKNARDRTVLNLFSYTCGFGLFARRGGATRAVNLDLSRKVLDWGEQNYSLNGVSTDRLDFISGDAFDWLARFAKKGEKFSMVVLDPPSFSSAKGERFSAASDYPKLVAAASKVCAPGGLLLACCNLEQMGAQRFTALISEGLAARKSRAVSAFGASAIDHAQPSRLKVHALELQ